MSKEKNTPTTRRAKEIKDLHRRRNVSGEWSDTVVPAEVKTNPTEVVSFRLPGIELDSLEEAAELAGENLSDFIRKAIALRIHGEPVGPAVDVTGTGLRVRSHIVTGTRSENPTDAAATLVGNFPSLHAGSH